MRALPLSPAGPIRRGALLTCGFFVFALVAAYEVSGYVISGDVSGLALIGLVFIGAAIVVAMLNNWRNGLYFFLGWLLFEDCARKFFGNNMAIYFAKDILVAVVYLSFFVAYRRHAKDIQKFRPPFGMAVLLLVWFGAAQVFNPASTHLLYGVLGMKVFFYYIPLLFLGYAVINSERELRRFFYINLGLMLVIAALGIAQAIIGPTFLNPSVIQEDIRLVSQTYRVAPISGAIVYRPTSVFVSTGRFSDLLIVAWFIVFGFSGYLLLRHRRGRIFAFLSLATTAAACLMCASRGVFMWTLGASLVGAAAFLWGAPWRQGEARRVIRTLQRAVLGVALGVVALLFAFPQALLDRLAVYSETLDPRSPAYEVARRAHDYPMANFLAAFNYDRWPYGYGIGTMSLGGQYVARIFHTQPPTTGVESGFGNIVLEMGIVGLALWLIMSAAISISAWRVVRKLKGSPWFPLAFMIFLYASMLLIPITYAGLQAYQDFVLNAYMWLLLGVLFRLPTLALSAQFAQVAAEGRGRRWIP
jgi:hypothetical protein